MTNTEPERLWAGDFGAAYTDRNPRTIVDLDALYAERFGVSRTDVNREFLGGLDRRCTVLEVGANIGLQLQGLRALGFDRVHGIELQGYALRQAREATPEAAMVQGSALALPFSGGAFDLVFTSALLIHIAPDSLVRAMAEIHRCTRAYIWGWEYYADTCTEVCYRGQENILWKTDFARLWLDHFPDLELVRERRMPYPDSSLEDTVYLLRKAR